MVIHKKLVPCKVSHEIDLSYFERLEAAFLEAKFQELLSIDGDGRGPELYTFGNCGRKSVRRWSGSGEEMICDSCGREGADEVIDPYLWELCIGGCVRSVGQKGRLTYDMRVLWKSNG